MEQKDKKSKLDYWRSVEYLTQHDDEEYDQFIDRVKGNPLARKVKIADLEDNSNL